MDCSELNKLGNQYYENGQFDKSIEYYKKVLETTDNKYYKENAFKSILRIYIYDMNKSDKALQFYTRAEEFGVDKYDLDILRLICNAFAKENRFDEALNYCNEYYLSGNIYYKDVIERNVGIFLKKYIESDKNAIDKIISADYPFVYWELGNIFYSKGEKQDIPLALDYWDKGASKSKFCVLKLIKHYAAAGDWTIHRYSPDCEYDKALEYAKIGYDHNLTINYGNDVSDVIRVILSNYDKFTREQINKIKGIILDSKELLFCLSLEYKFGDYNFEHKPNIEKFLYYCELSASKGYSRANETLADVYYNGEIVEKDYARALSYYEKAYKADKNIDMTNAINILNYIIEEDKGKLLAIINTETLDNYVAILVKESRKHSVKIQKMIYKIAHAISPDYSVALKYAYSENPKIDYKQLFKFYEKDIENCNDNYLKNIKEKIESGVEVIMVNNISDLTFNKLNSFSDDTIINIKNRKDVFRIPNSDFYTYSDIKKIIKVCNKLLDGIDLHQSEEDIFMQIYIKLANMISYDYKALENKRDEIKIRNLMTLLRKRGVCTGYAVVLKNVLSMVGIESNILGSGEHAYNQVKINGIWYYCDLTWGTDYIKHGKIKHCLQSKSSFIDVENGEYHQTLDESLEHEANKDYPQIKTLFYRNYIRLLKKNPLGMIEDLIIQSSLKDEEIKQVKGAMR